MFFNFIGGDYCRIFPVKPMEKTFVMIKPEGLQRGVAGEIIARLENKGLKMVAMKMLVISEDLAKRHYGEHIGKPFFENLVKYITCGPVIAMVLEGKNAVSTVRAMMGSTDPLKAEQGTIRAIYGMDMGRNIIHGSDSLASADREIGNFFKTEELIDYTRSIEPWIYE